MKVQNIKALTLLIFLCGLSLFVHAGFDNSEGNLKQVGKVDHESYTLVISDKIYRMPLNFKVYKEDANGRTRQVNRYAIQVGHSVYINTTRKSRVDYVTELLIVHQ